MHTVHLKLKQNPYKIVIGSGILSKLGAALKSLKIGDDAVVITNPVIAKFHGKAVASGLKRSGFSVKVLTVPAGEKSKSSQAAMKLVEQIAKHDVKKKIFVVALGGGVVGDLAGFVAAIYKRGVPYVQVPTTLLAQVDSAIGGKTAIDLPVGKNLVGAFYQPKIVWSDVAVLKTLGRRQIRNGLAEVIKYGVIKDKKLFNYVDARKEKILAGDPKSLVHIVKESSRIKADVVLSDEKETKGIRTILNFGHTVGHAVESAGKYNSYHHGEAIALGMRVAADISVRMRLLRKTDAALLGILLSQVGLPKNIKGVRLQKILDLMEHDKKFSGKKNRFVLATQIGQVRVVQDVQKRIIRASIKSLMA